MSEQEQLADAEERATVAFDVPRKRGERINEMQHLLEKWRAHVADVFKRRGRLEIYQPLEVFHTCHGCGGAGGLITRGLCPDCLDQFNQAMGETADATK